MVPTQILLTENQARILEQIAAEQGTTVTELIRQSIDDMIRYRTDISGGKQIDADREERRRRALSVVGAFSSGVDDLSINHDQYLAEAYANAAGDE
ncbi:MAG: hypothetical protein OXF86_09745 [Caldilineaceae bacterium]|nr:hypothetical protein [Caldilineaceae bacterium]